MLAESKKKCADDCDSKILNILKTTKTYIGQNKLDQDAKLLNYNKIFSIKDCIFIRDNKIGMGSYHFNEDKPFISFENPHPSWRLDDGNMLPKRKYFDSPKWDESTRTFTGSINWLPPF